MDNSPSGLRLTPRFIGKALWAIVIALILYWIVSTSIDGRHHWSNYLWSVSLFLFALDLTFFLLFIDSRRIAIQTIVVAQLFLFIASLVVWFTAKGEEGMALLLVPFIALVLVIHAFLARFVSGLFHESRNIAMVKSLRISGSVFFFWLVIVSLPSYIIPIFFRLLR